MIRQIERRRLIAIASPENTANTGLFDTSTNTTFDPSVTVRLYRGAIRLLSNGLAGHESPLLTSVSAESAPEFDAGLTSGSFGIVNEKRLPWPATDSTQMEPPCSRTIR